MAGDDPKSVKWFARVYDFLMDHGHINFGLCVPAAGKADDGKQGV